MSPDPIQLLCCAMGCFKVATVEIAGVGDEPMSETHSCDEHIADMLSSVNGTSTQWYVRALEPQEVRR